MGEGSGDLGGVLVKVDERSELPGDVGVSIMEEEEPIPPSEVGLEVADASEVGEAGGVVVVMVETEV